jgi:hypothetical protein
MCASELAMHPKGHEIPVALTVCTRLAVPGAVCEPGAKKSLAVNAGSLVAVPFDAVQTMSSANVKIPPAVAVK